MKKHGSIQWTALRGDLWRGAKVGFLTYIAVMIIVIMAIAVAMALQPAIWSDVLSRLSSHGGVTAIHIIGEIGGVAVAVAALGILYGAIPGALIMGIIVAVRRHRANKPADSDNDL
jgi:hypothetical protein